METGPPIEHRPWMGEQYCLGIEGQRIAIVGHSHWRTIDEKDTDDYTQMVLNEVIRGARVRFFPYIRGYFGGISNDFWQHVMFFNLLPECLPEDMKDSEGTEVQVKRAKDRFDGLIANTMPPPQKILVFTRKGWSNIPWKQNEERKALGPDFPPFFVWGVHQAGASKAMVFGLRHPQGAKGRLLRVAVRTILDMPLVDC